MRFSIWPDSRPVPPLGKCVALLLAVSASAAHAITQSDDLVDRIAVTATRMELVISDAPASVSVVTAEDIARRRAQRLGDVLGEIPGLYVRSNTFGASFPSSAQASIAIRGIPRTTRTLVLVDGLSINSALSGGIDLAAITLENVERIEVIRGPYSALYGGNAMAGVIHVISRKPSAAEFVGRVEQGLGAVRASGATMRAGNRDANGLGWSALLGYRASEAWPDSDYVVKTPAPGSGAAAGGARLTTTPDGRPALWLGNKGARPWDQRNAGLQFFGRAGPDDDWVAAVSYAAYNVGFRAPETFLTSTTGMPLLSGSISAAPLLAGRVQIAATDFAAFTPSNERDARASLRWERRMSNGGGFVAHAGFLDHRFDFAQPGATASFDAGPGTWTQQGDTRSDIDAHWRIPTGQSAWLTLGANASHQTMDRHDDATASWRNIYTRLNQLNRGRGTINSAAAFAQTEVSWTNRLTVYAGLRIDQFSTSGSVYQMTAPAFQSDFPTRVLRQISPKLALVFEASPMFTMRGSIGNGFRAPTLLDLYSRTVSPTNVAGVFSVNEASPQLGAETVRAAELGFDWRPSSLRKFSASVFSQSLENLIYRSRQSSTLTQSVNAGPGRGEGIEFEYRQKLGGGVSLFANVTRLLRARITENAAVSTSVGKTLPDVPTVQFNAGIDGANGAWKGSFILRHVGHVFGSGDDNNLNVVQGVYGSYDARTTLHARLVYQITPRVSVGIAVDNLTNKQYFDFAKQPGRNAVVELIVSLP
jgi:iron complex outermembrane receptor protein